LIGRAYDIIVGAGTAPDVEEIGVDNGNFHGLCFAGWGLGRWLRGRRRRLFIARARLRGLGWCWGFGWTGAGIIRGPRWCLGWRWCGFRVTAAAGQHQKQDF
jgi:hypothetical protein